MTDKGILSSFPAMARQEAFFPVLLFFIIIVRSSNAAVVPHQASPAAHSHGGAAADGGSSLQEVTSHPHLDLADLSLPPEVITEALFTQTDLLQDQLEQCEEMVRNNLNGDNTAETDGIEAAEDEMENDDDDNNEDNLNRKIAQIAIDVFSHHHDGQSEMDTDTSPIAPSQEPHRSSASNDADDAGAGQRAASPIKGKGQARDQKEKRSSKKEEEEEEGEEYIVHEDEEEAKGEHSRKAAERGEEAEKSRHSHDALEAERGKSQRQEEETQATDLPPTPLTETLPPDSEMDTRDADGEEPQDPAEDVSITTMSISDNSNSRNSSSSNNDDNENNNENNNNNNHNEEDSKSAAHLMSTAPQEEREEEEAEATTEDPEPMMRTTEDGHHSAADKEAAERTPSPAQPTEPDSDQKDNHSEGTRVKRSVIPPEPFVLTDQAREGGGDLGSVQRMTFGKGRIRRQASPPSRSEVESWLLKHVRTGGHNLPEEVTRNLLRSVLVHLRGVNSPWVNSPVAQEPVKSSPTRLNNPNPNENSQTVMDVFQDSTQLEKLADGETGDVFKMGDASVKLSQKNALRRDVIKMAAEEFLKTHKVSTFTSHLQGARKEDRELRNLLAQADSNISSSSSSSRAEQLQRRRRRRRSVLGQELSPERYVPLIDQLVERLNYLQHSVKVCLMLLPDGPLPDAAA